MVYTYDDLLKMNKYNFSFIPVILKCIFPPVEDKPGYYWLSKRNYQIISEETLKEVLKKYENKLP